MKRDILTIDDIELEIRVPLIMRRRRRELEHKLAINKLMMDADLAHAVAWAATDCQAGKT